VQILKFILLIFVVHLGFSKSIEQKADVANRQKWRALNREQRGRPNNEFAGPDHEQWGAWTVFPSVLRQQIPDAKDYYYRVSTHYRAQYWKISKNSSVKAKDLVSDPTRLQSDAELCWYTIASGGQNCYRYKELPSLLPSPVRLAQTDLADYGRELSVKYGLRLARELMRLALPTQSKDGSSLEQRLIHASEQKRKCDFRYNDSWYEMNEAQRSKVKFFFVYGQSHNKRTSPAVKALDQMVVYLNRIGFKAEFIQNRQGAATWENATMIRDQIRDHLDDVDSAVIIPISKGSHEVVLFVLDQLSNMDSEKAEKVKLVVSLSGVIRYSYLSRWVMITPPAGPTRFMFKSLTFLKGGEERANLVKGSLASLATDPWEKMPASFKQPQHLKWVNFAMLPDKPDGTQKYSLVELVFPWVLNANAKIGPQDGATETATSILPPGTGFEQHIIRAYGPHNLVPGKYMNGTLVAPVFHNKSVKHREAAGGEDFMDSVVRAFPQSLLKD
jgi:hypothetical protein